jgi:PAS domain S-box-containing protein
MKGRISTWNRGAEKLFGYSSAEVASEPIRMLFPPQAEREVSEITVRINRGEVVDHCEMVLCGKGGAHIEVSAMLSPIKDAVGAIIGISSSFRDITPQKFAEREIYRLNKELEGALKESKERFKLMVNSIPQLAWMADSEGLIFWYNERWYEYTGTTFEQMERCGWQSVHDPAILPTVIVRWKAAIALGAAFDMEFPLRGADGCFRLFLTRVRPARDFEGSVVRWFGTNTDITDLRRAEEMRERQAAIIDSSDDAIIGIVGKTLDGRITTWNRGAENLFGYSAVEAIGKPIQMLIPPDKESEEPEILARIGRGEGVEHFETVRVRKGGERIDVSVTISPIRDSTGAIVGASKIARDITQRKRSEEAFHEQAKALALAQLHSQQMQLKDEFFSHVSHELRSPLTAIRQFVTILTDRLAGDLNAEQDQYLEVVLRNVKQLQSMIDDLFEVSGIGAGKLRIDLEDASVSEAIADTCNSLHGAAKAKGISLSSDVQCDLPSAYADPVRIRQILIILADNAIKFTPANGTVKIHARVLKEDPNRMVLEVSDSGCGISPEMCERIFERLFQAQDPRNAGRKGLGLGLYICKELVTRQGGQIRVQSGFGEGAVFSMTFPIFSLRNLLAPAFEKKGLAQSPLMLAVTEVSSPGSWQSNVTRAEQRRIIGHLLQGCLHSDSDVLLPKMGVTREQQLFFIVAATGQIGGEAICKRIRENLAEHIQQAGLTLSTSYRVLGMIKPPAGEPLEEFRDKAAANIEAIMKQEISLRMVKSEQ